MMHYGSQTIVIVFIEKKTLIFYTILNFFHLLLFKCTNFIFNLFYCYYFIENIFQSIDFNY